jgi:hypothetical protein
MFIALSYSTFPINEDKIVKMGTYFNDNCGGHCSWFIYHDYNDIDFIPDIGIYNYYNEKYLYIFEIENSDNQLMNIYKDFIKMNQNQNKYESTNKDNSLLISVVLSDFELKNYNITDEIFIDDIQTEIEEYGDVYGSVL